MNNNIKKIMKLLGVASIRNSLLTIIRYPGFALDLIAFIKLHRNAKNKRFEFKFIDLYPRVNDKTTNTDFDKHYIFHTAWAARKLKEIKPDIHYDISSSIYFNAITSAFVPIKFYDYRPADLKLHGLSSEHADLYKLPFEDNSIKSLSCMHVIEHIGLARYGDPMDYDGDLKAIDEIKRVLSPDGDLLFVVPIGKSKIMYNAHRIYSYKQVLSLFSEFEVKEFSLIQDDKTEHSIAYNATEELSNKQEYGCGLFWLRKL